LVRSTLYLPPSTFPTIKHRESPHEASPSPPRTWPAGRDGDSGGGVVDRRGAGGTLGRQRVGRGAVGYPLRCVGRNHRRRSQYLPNRASPGRPGDRKSTRLNSSHVKISYAVFCLKKKKPVPPSTGSRN